jgi:hypothetical protein
MQKTITKENQRFDLSIFEVVDGKINLTKMAQSQGKEVREFTRLKGTIAFVEALVVAVGDHTHLISIDGVGTFGSQEIALKLAQWISPEFEVFCIKNLKTTSLDGKEQYLRWLREEEKFNF